MKEQISLLDLTVYDPWGRVLSSFSPSLRSRKASGINIHQHTARCRGETLISSWHVMNFVSLLNIISLHFTRPHDVPLIIWG